MFKDKKLKTVVKLFLKPIKLYNLQSLLTVPKCVTQIKNTVIASSCIALPTWPLSKSSGDKDAHFWTVICSEALVACTSMYTTKKSVKNAKKRTWKRCWNHAWLSHHHTHKSVSDCRLVCFRKLQKGKGKGYLRCCRIIRQVLCLKLRCCVKTQPARLFKWSQTVTKWGCQRRGLWQKIM